MTDNQKQILQLFNHISDMITVLRRIQKDIEKILWEDGCDMDFIDPVNRP